MTKVKIRKKPLTGGRHSLYLDFYPPILHPDTGKETRWEFLKLYASLIDINQPKYEAFKSDWDNSERSEGLDLKVLATIAFLSIIYWKKDRDVVQLNIATQYKEQGIQSNINEIKPLRNIQ